MSERARELYLYDGQECLGTIKVRGDGEHRAFDRRGKRLGKFASLKAALAAFKKRRARQRA